MDKKELEFTSSGTTCGYMPMFYNDKTEMWEQIKFNIGKNNIDGVPYPNEIYSSWLMMNGLFGYEQALALAWWFIADVVSKTNKNIVVRIDKYDVEFSSEIKKNQFELFVGK